MGAQSLHERIEAQADRQPNATAVTCDGVDVSYAELDRRANRLASFLRRRGVGEDVPVGLCLERSIDMIVAVVAVLKAGGAYVPLDPTYPHDRLSFMIEHAGVKTVLAHASLRERLEPTSAEVVVLDETRAAIAAEPDVRLGVAPPPEALAYTIFTSGSTGRPKGVMVPRGAVLALVDAVFEHLPLDAHDRVLQQTSLSFDIAGFEILGTLVGGACCVVAPHGMPLDAIGRHLEAWKVTCAQATPTGWRLLSHGPLVSGLKMISVGEALPQDLAERLVAAGGELWNMYGPTETTIYSSYHRVVVGTPVTIGRPLAGQALYILDDARVPVPAGEIGEIYIGGVGVTRGYASAPALTAERFVADPFRGGGARMYATGDLGRALPNGEFAYCGRRDGQVKLRGYRIELGEIEVTLRALTGVTDAAAVVREDAGEPRIVAYLTSAREAGWTPSRLRAALAPKLPPYMVPAAFVLLPAFPLLPSGKLDRRSLPAPDAEAVVRDAYVAPATDLERLIASLYARVLHVEPVGRDDDFFGLGGDSMLAVAMAANAKRLGLTLTLDHLVRHSTVSGLAHALRDSAPSTSPESPTDRATSSAWPKTRVAVSGDGPPLWIVLGTEGEDERVAERVPNDHVKLLFAPLGDTAGSDRALHEAASLCAATLFREGVESPLRLAGLGANGGALTLELASRWRLAGRDVERVAVVFAPPPRRARRGEPAPGAAYDGPIDLICRPDDGLAKAWSAFAAGPVEVCEVKDVDGVPPALARLFAAR